MSLEATTPASPAQIQPATSSSGFSFGKWWLHLILLAFAGFFIAPLVVMIGVSIVPTVAFLARDFSPSRWTLENYFYVFEVMPFARFYLNSIIVTVSVLVLQLLVSSLAAFAFARLRFKGREMLFLAYLATLMIPFPVTLIPNFLLIQRFGWFDTYWALIVPSIFSVFSTFLLRQYYRGLPLDYDEAARMDGAGSLRIWWQIIMPLSAPVLGTLAIFTFQAVWNDFLWPLVVTRSPSMRTIPIGLNALVGQFSTDWSPLMAGSVIALLPVLIIYLFAQNLFVRGISLSGLGGR